MLARAAVVALGLLLVPMDARAVTLRDIIELSNAGLPDTVLIALIDADRTVFTLTPAQILGLHQARVSDAVVVKMIRSRGEFWPESDSSTSDPPTPTFLTTGAASIPQQAPFIVAVPVPFVVRVPVDPAEMNRARDFRQPSVDRTRESKRRGDHDDNDRKNADGRSGKDADSTLHHGGGISAGLRIRNGEFVR